LGEGRLRISEVYNAGSKIAANLSADEVRSTEYYLPAVAESLRSFKTMCGHFGAPLV
jgi:hypothetical protein